MKSLLLLGLLWSCLALAAPCGPHPWTASKDVKMSSDKVLIVTHPSTQWDGRFASKVGMDAAVTFAKKNSIPVIYLEARTDSQTYFFSDCNPNYWVESYGGEFDFAVTANHVYSVGGHWELCQRNTQADLMGAWSSKRSVDLTFTQVLDGLYAYGEHVTTSDPYHGDFKRFMDIVSFRKPGADWPKRKLNMLEMMGVVNDDAREVQYLKRNLPDYSLLHASYRVVLFYNGKQVEILRQGIGENPPTFKLEFMDSLFTDGFSPAIPRH